MRKEERVALGRPEAAQFRGGSVAHSCAGAVSSRPGLTGLLRKAVLALSCDRRLQDGFSLVQEVVTESFHSRDSSSYLSHSFPYSVPVQWASAVWTGLK